MRVVIKFSLMVFLTCIFSSFVLAATVHGNIYDLSLNKISGSELEVNTTPIQFHISKDGSYSFNIPNGFYEINVKYRKNGNFLSESKKVSINQDGNFTIDLILFPSFEEEDELSKGPDLDIPETEEKSFSSFLVLIFVFIIGIVVYIIFKGKSKTKDVEDNKEEDYEKDLDNVVDIIKKEGGRTTQKEIRKKIPMSEAKISLMIAELENEGLIEKIKKGRGNIIVLKKRQ